MESMVSACSHLVLEESVEQNELSTPEVRQQAYRAESSHAPDLGRWFLVSLPGVACFSISVGAKIRGLS